MNRKEIINQSDKELILLFQDKYDIAFDVLYKRHYQNVYRYLRNLTKHKEKAEDLTQDVFLRVLICFKSNKFIGTDFFSQYLKSLSYITFIENIRSSKEILCDSDNFFENMIDETANIQQLIIREENSNQLRLLVSTLPNNKQNIINLHIYDNKVFRSISEDLNISQTTIMSQYYSSIEQLRHTSYKMIFRFAI